MSFSLYHLPQNVYHTNPYEVSRIFCEKYYSMLTMYGFSEIVHLFDQYCCCNYDGYEIAGIVNVANLILSEGVYNIHYDNLICTPLIIDNNTLLVQVRGLQWLVLFNGVYFSRNFVETFILSFVGNRVIVTKYLFRTI